MKTLNKTWLKSIILCLVLTGCNNGFQALSDHATDFSSNGIFLDKARVPRSATQSLAQSADGTTVPSASQIVDSKGGVWTITSAGTVNLNGSAAGYSANVILLVYKDGRVYQENSSGGFWYWDGSTWIESGDPRSSSSPSVTPSADGTTIPSASQIIDNEGDVWTVSSGVIYRNGSLAGYSANVILLVFKNGKVYQENSAGGFWFWDGSTWVDSSDPRGSTPTMPTQSADGTTVPSASQIVDSNGGVWTITSSGTINLNGAPAGYSANVTLLIYKGGKVYQQNSAGGFWYWDGNTWIASSDPRSSAPPPPTTPTQSADGTIVPSAARIVDSQLAIWTVSSGIVYRNGSPAGYSANVILLIYKSGRVYQQNSSGGFWYWDGSTWQASSDPRDGSTPTTQPPPPASGGNYDPNSITMHYDEVHIVTGPYAIENNKWGAAISGVPLTQATGIGPIDSSGVISARWFWDCSSSSCQFSDQEVKGYPEIEYGQKPGYTANPGSKLPRLVNSLSSVPMSWNVTESMTGRAHLAFDCWLVSNPNPAPGFNAAPITHEIMINVDQRDYVFGAGSSLGNVVIDGFTFNVRFADNFPYGSAKTWRFVVLQLVYPNSTNPMTNLNASLDFKHVLDALKRLGMVSGNEYLSSIEFGSEMVYGTGDVFVHSFKVDVF
jgi:hypothetical protein